MQTQGHNISLYMFTKVALYNQSLIYAQRSIISEVLWRSASWFLLTSSFASKLLWLLLNISYVRPLISGRRYQFPISVVFFLAQMSKLFLFFAFLSPFMMITSHQKHVVGTLYLQERILPEKKIFLWKVTNPHSTTSLFWKTDPIWWALEP